MTTFIAQTAAPASAQSQGGSPLFTWGYLGLMAAGLYFLIIAPARKKQKELEKMLSTLQVGDEVLTTGGIYGTITNVKADRFVVRIGDDTKVEIGRAFIQSATKKSGTD